MNESAVDSLDLASGIEGAPFEAELDLSEVGGEGGVGVSDVEEADLVAGVGIVGDELDVVGDTSDIADCGRASSETIGVGFLPCALSTADSALRSLSCRMSASILRSLSSSRKRWVSILRASLSCSPLLISSSAITPLSIAILYFDSRSSKDEFVFLACRSKLSFDTSMSRNLDCVVLLVSRKLVISFCRVFCAVLASAFACLYFAYMFPSKPTLYIMWTR